MRAGRVGASWLAMNLPQPLLQVAYPDNSPSPTHLCHPPSAPHAREHEHQAHNGHVARHRLQGAGQPAAAGAALLGAVLAGLLVVLGGLGGGGLACGVQVGRGKVAVGWAGEEMSAQ